jgi:alkylation response protein AidB-like acyl-CoA dehydrogenase
MDLELSDEQTWLSESIDTLLHREWVGPEALDRATDERRRRVWEQLVEFGALTIGGEDGLGAIELCLIARALGSRLASVPFLGSAAVRLALAPLASSLSGTGAEVLTSDAALAIALLEPGSSWSVARLGTRARNTGDGFELHGEKVGIEQLEAADRLAVVAELDERPALVLTRASAAGVRRAPQPSFDPALYMGSARFEGTPVAPDCAVTGPAGETAVVRLNTVGSLLAGAEAIGAATTILELACRYASERRQFGRTIGSFQSLRHLLADMYVRQASGWSTVLYAAAAFDDGAADPGRTASIAKAYVSRGAREVAHGAMQIFGGIAFTAEHPAHRFLRRIVVREQQFGDAAYHEQELGRALAARPGAARRALAEASVS